MKMYSRYYPYNSKADVVYQQLEKIYSLMSIPYEISMQDSNDPRYKTIIVVYDSADVINYVETHNSSPVGRKPAILPSREELFLELEQGYTKKELAQKYGVSRPTLYKRLGLNKKDE